MEAPIPGQSLTNDPNNPQPYERPPEFTKKKDALEAIFSNMVAEDVYVPMMQAILEGTTVMEMTQVLLFEGFRQGKWNPDLFIMLVEPTAYIIMALAERADIDYEIDREGQEPEADSVISEKFDKIGDKIQKGQVKDGIIPDEIEEKIEQLPVDSLIAKPEPEAEVVEEESLINKRV